MGNRGGSGRGRGKKRDMGRKEWSRQNLDKRKRNEEEQETKRRKVEEGSEVKVPIYATQFSQEDIDSEQRRPKKKVAVMLGYSGTGYKGMQMSETEKTIEGDLFAAFVKAGAISKANAVDPKKSSFVRCARTDKGVHAAGNIVSLKLIVEDPDIVQKINEQLSPQIRVWGYVTTNKSFSCYQLCDSRMYEYLIPTHCFLPPHPSTFLGKKLVEYAEKENDQEAFKARQEEVASFWEVAENDYIKPLLATFPEEIRNLVQKALYLEEEIGEGKDLEKVAESAPTDIPSAVEGTQAEAGTASTEQPACQAAEDTEGTESSTDKRPPFHPRSEINAAVKAVRQAIMKAKRAYRIHPTRQKRLQDALNMYLGTKNFYSYTIQKTYTDNSAKRVIKSFNVNPTPIVIDGTEWLSLKVHGQSFMMHQIRKMVAMATLVVRCGCDISRINDTYGPKKISIPKAPGLGLLLERPIFDTYNKKAEKELVDKKPINFGKYEKEMNEFKQREIYSRIYREEEETNAFNNFFSHLDNVQTTELFYLTSAGIDAASSSLQPGEQAKGREAEADSEDELLDGGEEGG